MRLTLSCRRVTAPESDGVASANKAEGITEDETILRDNSWKSRCHADGTKDFQAGKLVVIVHFSFRNPNIRPIERSNSLRAGSSADIAKPCIVQPSVTKTVGVGNREHSEGRIAGARKATDIARRIEAVARKCYVLSIICHEQSHVDLAGRRREVVNVGYVLVFREMAGIGEN